MSSDSSYSTRPSGGAPLNSTSSPSCTDDSDSPSLCRRTKTPNPPVPTSQEIEAELMIASSAFGREPEPFGPQPSYPQSVQPGFHSYGRGRGAPTPPSRHMGPQPTVRSGYRDDARSRSSASSGQSRFSAWSGAGGAGMLGEDPSLHMSRIIQERIMTCSQFVQRMPNVPANIANQHQRLCQEISQLTNSVIHNLRHDRDAARDQSEVHAKYQDALNTQTSLEAERDALHKRLNYSLERERGTQRELQGWEFRLETKTKQLATLETKAKKFQDHHTKVTEEWEKQDKRSFKQIQALENEVKKLRARTAMLAEKANVPVDEALKVEPNEFPSPSIPSVSVASHHSLDKDTTQDLIARLINPGEKESGEKASGFRPNPQAPAWKPTSSSKVSKAEIGLPIGGPSNWPALLKPDSQEGTVQSSITPSSSGSSGMIPAVITKGDLAPQTKIARHKKKWDIHDIREATEHLYAMTKGYVVNCHLKADDPPKIPYDRLEFEERPTWTYLLNLAYPDQEQAAVHIRYLLNIDTYRQHVIVRVILDYLFKKMLSPRVFLGISTEVDAHLSALQEKIAMLGQPEGSQNSAQARARSQVLDQHARVVAYALTFKNAESFKEGTVKRHAEILCRILKPLRCASADDERATRLLQLITEVTWEISSKVWASGLTLNYQFAECGSLYTPGTMEAINAGSLGYASKELQNHHLRVSFVATPMLTVRDEGLEGGNVLVQGVKKAAVLLMK
ncbi:hypothetical protein GGR53DRAFT_486117 [Hypoxylon sp. FL1150]|nr:hypothetical protein GGR53DRAFT_486117 [Hypoxylon sp. FL1150]